MSQPRQSEIARREYMLRLCAVHKSQITYTESGERQCPQGCVGGRVEWVVAVPLKDVLALLREADAQDAARLIEEAYRLA